VKDYYDAEPPEGPPWDKAMEACCPDCDKHGRCLIEKGTACPETCLILCGWFQEQAEEDEARDYDARLRAGEMRNDA
jgi:hypothetical protein